MIEVVVPGKQSQIMLHYKCCYPDIIGGNRGPLTTQLKEELCILVRRHLSGIEDGYALPVEKEIQSAFILASSGPAQEPSAQFCQDDKGKKDLFCRL